MNIKILQEFIKDFKWIDNLKELDKFKVLNSYKNKLLKLYEMMREKDMENIKCKKLKDHFKIKN